MIITAVVWKGDDPAAWRVSADEGGVLAFVILICGALDYALMTWSNQVVGHLCPCLCRGRPRSAVPCLLDVTGRHRPHPHISRTPITTSSLLPNGKRPARGLQPARHRERMV